MSPPPPRSRTNATMPCPDHCSTTIGIATTTTGLGPTQLRQGSQTAAIRCSMSSHVLAASPPLQSDTTTAALPSKSRCATRTTCPAQAVAVLDVRPGAGYRRSVHLDGHIVVSPRGTCKELAFPHTHTKPQGKGRCTRIRIARPSS